MWTVGQLLHNLECLIDDFILPEKCLTRGVRLSWAQKLVCWFPMRESSCHESCLSCCTVKISVCLMITGWSKHFTVSFSKSIYRLSWGFVFLMIVRLIFWTKLVVTILGFIYWWSWDVEVTLEITSFCWNGWFYKANSVEGKCFSGQRKVEIILVNDKFWATMLFSPAITIILLLLLSLTLMSADAAIGIMIM